MEAKDLYKYKLGFMADDAKVLKHDLAGKIHSAGFCIETLLENKTSDKSQEYLQKMKENIQFILKYLNDYCEVCQKNSTDSMPTLLGDLLGQVETKISAHFFKYNISKVMSYEEIPQFSLVGCSLECLNSVTYSLVSVLVERKLKFNDTISSIFFKLEDDVLTISCDVGMGFESLSSYLASEKNNLAHFNEVKFGLNWGGSTDILDSLLDINKTTFKLKLKLK